MCKIFNQFFRGVMLFIILSISFYSCDEEVSVNFKDDPLISELAQNLQEFRGLDPNDFSKIVSNRARAKVITDQLSVKYGDSNQVDGFFAELISRENEVRFSRSEMLPGEHDGDPCTRNEDGTTYWDTCSFWEELRVYWASRGCDQENITELYDCVQSKICKHCGDDEL